MPTRFVMNYCREWGRTAAATAVLCAVIAMVTQLINGQSYWLNLWISLGYGESIVLSLMLLHLLRPQWPDWILNGLALLSGVGLGMLNLALTMWWFGTLDELKGNSLTLYSNLGIGLFFGSFGLFFFYALYRLQAMRAELSERRRLQAEHERAETLSRLKVMQSQIEPHFLFNTLANIQALISVDPKRAGDMVQALTAMLRTNLTRVRAEHTSLGDELAIIDHYLAIQSIRMGDRLHYEISVPDEIKAMPMPPLLLQPLVENAVKHGLEPKPGGGSIRIHIADTGSGNCELRVEDTGLGTEATASTQGEGVGLHNVRERLQALYGDSASLQLLTLPGGGMRALIRLPLVTDDVGMESHDD